MRRTDRSRPPSGIPCNPPPWGTLAAVNLATGDVRGRCRSATAAGRPPVHGPRGTPPIGTPTSGGPLVTAGGLVVHRRRRWTSGFAPSTSRPAASSGSATLPLAGIATPMTYQADGRQFVVIAAGGHGKAELPIGDAVVAFALPR